MTKTAEGLLTNFQIPKPPFFVIFYTIQRACRLRLNKGGFLQKKSYRTVWWLPYGPRGGTGQKNSKKIPPPPGKKYPIIKAVHKEKGLKLKFARRTIVNFLHKGSEYFF